MVTLILLSGAIVGSLVREFLSCFNLDFTIAVFDPECCHVSEDLTVYVLSNSYLFLMW